MSAGREVEVRLEGLDEVWKLSPRELETLEAAPRPEIRFESPAVSGGDPPSEQGRGWVYVCSPFELKNFTEWSAISVPTLFCEEYPDSTLGNCLLTMLTQQSWGA